MRFKKKFELQLPFQVYVETEPDGNAPLFAAFWKEKPAQRFIQAAKDDLGEDFEPEKWFILNRDTMTFVPHDIS